MFQSFGVIYETIILTAYLPCIVALLESSPDRSTVLSPTAYYCSSMQEQAVVVLHLYQTAKQQARLKLELHDGIHLELYCVPCIRNHRVTPASLVGFVSTVVRPRQH